MHACWWRCPVPDSSCVSVQTLQPQLDALHDDLMHLSADVRGEADKRAVAEQELGTLRAALEKASCSTVCLSPCPARPVPAQLHPLCWHSLFWQIWSDSRCTHTTAIILAWWRAAHLNGSCLCTVA